jgi:enoyl-CoA hydratase
MPDITLAIDSRHIGLLTVNRPHVRNALSWDAMRAFAEGVEQAHATPALRALIITGAGKAFSAGGDMNDLKDSPTREAGLRLAIIMGDALARLDALPCPTLAALNGPALGGGAEIAVTCDLRVMAEDATIGFVQARLGLIPGWGGGQRLMRVVGYARALELLTTARVLSAGEAHALGLANQIAGAGQALVAAHKLAEQIAAHPPAAVQAAKRVLRYGLTPETGAALEHERAEFPPLWESDFRHEAMRKFLGGER